jgi:hypothetical protein
LLIPQTEKASFTVIKALGQLTLKMTELMEAEGRVAKTEVHLMIKSLTLYMVSGILCVLGVIALVAGFYDLLLQVMSPGAAMLVGAMLLITISSVFANFAGYS